MSRCTAPTSVTSVGTANASAPLSVRSVATCSSVSRVRAASTTFAPAAAKADAVALPIPFDAPVTTTTFPSSFTASGVFGWLEETMFTSKFYLFVTTKN